MGSHFIKEDINGDINGEFMQNDFTQRVNVWEKLSRKVLKSIHNSLMSEAICIFKKLWLRMVFVAMVNRKILRY